MTTVRQMERLWSGKCYQKLLRDMLAHRMEGAFAMEAEMNVAPAAAAAGLIRLVELGQAHTPLASQLVRFLVGTQHADGGWGDAATTALCLRALMTCRGEGATIDRGIRFLAELQRDDGLWPKIPIRRLPGDAMVSAFVLQQLGADSRFHEVCRVNDALNWERVHQSRLEPAARKAWERATFRCRSNRRLHSTPAMVWS